MRKKFLVEVNPELVAQLPYRCDEDGNVDPYKLDDLMPWSNKIPKDCQKIHR